MALTAPVDPRTVKATELRNHASQYDRWASELRTQADELDSAVAFGDAVPPEPERRGSGWLTARVLDHLTDKWRDAATMATELRLDKPDSAAVLSRLKTAGKLESRKLAGRPTEYKTKPGAAGEEE